MARINTAGGALTMPSDRKLSQHKFGRALDPKFKHVSAEEVRQEILSDPHCEDFKYIRCIEMDVSWIHFDTRKLG